MAQETMLKPKMILNLVGSGNLSPASSIRNFSSKATAGLTRSVEALCNTVEVLGHAWRAELVNSRSSQSVKGSANVAPWSLPLLQTTLQIFMMPPGISTTRHAPVFKGSLVSSRKPLLDRSVTSSSCPSLMPLWQRTPSLTRQRSSRRRPSSSSWTRTAENANAVCLASLRFFRYFDLREAKASPRFLRCGSVTRDLPETYRRVGDDPCLPSLTRVSDETWLWFLVLCSNQNPPARLCYRACKMPMKHDDIASRVQVTRTRRYRRYALTNSSATGVKYEGPVAATLASGRFSAASLAWTGSRRGLAADRLATFATIGVCRTIGRAQLFATHKFIRRILCHACVMAWGRPAQVVFDCAQHRMFRRK